MTTRRPAGASVPTDATTGGDPAAPVTGAADVLADGSGRLGLLSYLVPDGMTVRPGDAVEVPFGTKVRHGLVVGPATTPEKATKAISVVHGKRTNPADIALARNIARFHFSDVTTVFPRLAPRTGRGAEPLEDRTVTLASHIPAAPVVRGSGADGPRRLLVRAPLVDPAVLAAHEADRLAAATGGQVLVLCPTVELVAAVTACFTAGAQRLDGKAAKGAWKGFATGSVRIGVGTRAAALYSADALAGIVVADEDHPGHLEATLPYTHARDVASARARALHIPLTLISANPTPQALGAGVAVLTAGTRSDWPRMRLVDRGDVDPITRWAPPQLASALRGEARDGRTPVVVVQRKAAVRRCTRCGDPRPCAMCDSSLCRHPEPAPCPKCASTTVRMAGWDSTRVADLLAPIAPVKVITLAELADVRDAGLVVLFDIDAALGAAELIPDTLAASLIVTAARAAGAGGSVLALTDAPDTPVLDDLFTRRDQLAVARRAFTAAKSAKLPPFGRLVNIRCAQERAPRTAGWPGTVHGPRKTGAEWELIVRVPADALLELEPHIARLRRGGKVRVTVS